MTPTLALKGGTPAYTGEFPQWPIWDSREIDAVTTVICSGKWFQSQGDMAKQLEAEFAEFHQADHAIAVTNGSHAISVALLALGIGPGDEVIVPDYTFMATASEVLNANAIPVFADVDPRTWCLDPEQAIPRITPRTKALIPVHFAGHPADLDALGKLVQQRGLSWIEDSAHAHGAVWQGRRIGSFGNLATFSFQASKTMTAGEGGMILTNDEQLAENCRSIINCGRKPGFHDYRHFRLGSNYRMSELQAAVLRVQLARLPQQLERRNENARYLTDLLEEIPGITPQAWDPRCQMRGLYLYPFLYDSRDFQEIPRDTFSAALAAEGIPTERAYPAIHELEFLRTTSFRPRGCPVSCGYYDGELALEPERFPVASRLSQQMVWIKHRALLGERQDMEVIAEAIRKIHTCAGQLG